MITEEVWRILIALNLPSSSASLVSIGLENLGILGEFAEAELEAKLIEIEALNTKLAKESGSTNFALEKADVLGYDASLRVAGIITLLENSMKRIGEILGVKPDFSALETFKKATRPQGVAAGRLNRYR